MDRFFKLKQNGTTVRTEIMAGLTTFMAMAYILSINPNTLTAFGQIDMGWYSVFLATALAAGIFTIAMGLFINFPVALAPGMGLNAYFASVVLSSATTDHPFTWQMGLTAVFISGLIFILLTITHIRQMLLDAIPDSLKHAITVGIGLFITVLGLKNSGLMAIGVEAGTDIPAHTYTEVLSFETVIHLGSLLDTNVQLALVGIILIAILMVLNVRGAILFGILGTTVVGILMGAVDFNTLSSPDNHWVPDFTQLNFVAFDWDGILHTGLVRLPGL